MIRRSARVCRIWSVTTTFIAIWRRVIVSSDPKTLSKWPISVSPVTYSTINTLVQVAQNSPSNGHRRKFSTTHDSRPRAMSGHTVCGNHRKILSSSECTIFLNRSDCRCAHVGGIHMRQNAIRSSQEHRSRRTCTTWHHFGATKGLR